jgi:hypothetical protein
MSNDVASTPALTQQPVRGRPARRGVSLPAGLVFCDGVLVERRGAQRAPLVTAHPEIEIDQHD